MLSFLQQLFDTSGFPARWACGNWSSAHGWLHILSDIAIFGAYAAIPLGLAYFIRRRKDMPFIPLFWLFAAFIFSCGFGHLVDASLFWHPWYRFSGGVKLLTAVVSWLTVIALLKILPVALSLPGLAKVNRQLEVEINERKRAEEHVRQLNNELERRVHERTAELEASNQELAAFSSSVSHDLRAPLRGIDGFAYALEEDYADKLDEAGRDHLARVRAAAQRMGGLIDDFVKLARITRTELKREPVDLSALARTIAAELQQRDPQRRVQWQITDGLTADGDPQLLRVALDNLLANAWKFTGNRPDAHIEFGMQTPAEGRDGAPRDPNAPPPSSHAPVFFVRDNGAGFDMADAPRLFGTFQRLHSPAEFEGTGIGLATVHRVLQRHGGRIRAEGAVDNGAIFYFTLQP